MSRRTAIAMEIYWEHILRRPDASSIEAPFQYRYTTGGGRRDCWIAVHDEQTVFYSRPGDILTRPLPYAISEAWFLCWEAEACA
jgi:hypothetical protein